MNVLERIVAQTREELARREAQQPASTIRDAAERAAAEQPRRAFPEALALGPGISVIAEHKRRSPSAGEIRSGVALEEIVGAYERAGATALSILTEGPNFGGSLADLTAARAATALPLLRKDFLVGSYQIHEAVLAGADAILLIVAALTPEELRALQEEAWSFGLAALVEVHDERELAIAADAGASLIGINNRDLTTLEVDLRRTFELMPGVPPDAVAVAESGFRTREELEELLDAGVDAVLIGESLMRSPDIEAACRALTS